MWHRIGRPLRLSCQADPATQSTRPRNSQTSHSIMVGSCPADPAAGHYAHRQSPAASDGLGSNAIGIFSAVLDDEECKLFGVEPAGKSLDKLGNHAATMTLGKPGIIHGFKCYLLQDEKGEPAPVHSIASGLDYPGVGPEHAYLHDIGRAEYRAVNDDAAMAAFSLFSRTEGIIPAIETAHALAGALQIGNELGPDAILLINLSGRGDKDVHTAAQYFGIPL